MSYINQELSTQMRQAIELDQETYVETALSLLDGTRIRHIWLTCGCVLDFEIEELPGSLQLSPYACPEHGGFHLGEGPGQTLIIPAIRELPR